MSTPYHGTLLSILMISVTAAGLTPAEEQTTSVRVRTGNISTLAVGEGANASVNLGGLPVQSRNACGKINVEHGDIQRIALGNNATVTVEFPEISFTCKGEQP
jgi:hypothetical protein